MSAETLRRAASLMRENAEAARACAPSPWEAHAATNGDPSDGPTLMRVSDASHTPVADADYDRFGGDMTAHIASWHPAVALAVADSLVAAAAHIESHECEAHCEPDGCELVLTATRTARTYLGDS